jgi:hypothetical protein
MTPPDDDPYFITPEQEAVLEAKAAQQELATRTGDGAAFWADALERQLVSMMVGGCTCGIKSPDLHWHAPDCKYLQASNALGMVEELRDAIVPAAYPKQVEAERAELWSRLRNSWEEDECPSWSQVEPIIVDIFDLISVAATRPTYEQIIALVEDCRARRDKSGESSRMMSKWISEGLNALF